MTSLYKVFPRVYSNVMVNDDPKVLKAVEDTLFSLVLHDTLVGSELDKLEQAVASFKRAVAVRRHSDQNPNQYGSYQSTIPHNDEYRVNQIFNFAKALREYQAGC